MARSEAQKRADKNYAAKFFLLRVKLPLEEKAVIDDYIDITGESISAFVRRAIKTTMACEDPYAVRMGGREELI